MSVFFLLFSSVCFLRVLLVHIVCMRVIYDVMFSAVCVSYEFLRMPFLYVCSVFVFPLKSALCVYAISFFFMCVWLYVVVLYCFTMLCFRIRVYCVFLPCCCICDVHMFAFISSVYSVCVFVMFRFTMRFFHLFDHVLFSDVC